jgi:hypothetical protein
MNTIDRETVQLLMHNLTVNLNNQVFRDQHGALLDQYRTLLNKPSSSPSSDSSLVAGSNMSPSVSSGGNHYPPFSTLHAPPPLYIPFHLSLCMGPIENTELESTFCSVLNCSTFYTPLSLILYLHSLFCRFY